jgi:formate-dependent nitrite reductase membrane component NrfD
MKIAIQLFLIGISLWSAHLAGAMYVRPSENTSVQHAAILRSIISIIAAVAVLVV